MQLPTQPSSHPLPHVVPYSASFTKHGSRYVDPAELIAPPPSPSPTYPSASHIIPNFSCPTIPTLSGGLTNEWTWDMMLRLFSYGRYAGRLASEYRVFDAIAPYYLKDPKATPAWVLGRIRGNIPSEHVKLTPGDAICLQDTSRNQFLIAPESPTLFGVITQPAWREPGYHICGFDVHILSRDGLVPIEINTTLIAIPTDLIPDNIRLPKFRRTSLGQRVVGSVDEVSPPFRYWEEDIVWVRPRMSYLAWVEVVPRSELVKAWIDSQANIWIKGTQISWNLFI